MAVSLLGRLRWAIAPDQRRSLSIMTGGVAVFVAIGALAMVIELPRALAGLAGLAMLSAWLVALCGMVGYLRWFFRSEVDGQTRR